MNNSVFGNTMENIRKRVDIRLVSGGEKGEKKVEKLAAKPSFEGCTIFHKNLVAMHMHKTSLVFNKPVYLGMYILDLSKTLMYDSHYRYTKPKYGDKAKLLFTATDSLAHEITTDDFFRRYMRRRLWVIRQVASSRPTLVFDVKWGVLTSCTERKKILTFFILKCNCWIQVLDVMLKVGIDGCQNKVNGNWDENKSIFLLSFVSTSRSQA